MSKNDHHLDAATGDVRPGLFATTREEGEFRIRRFVVEEVSKQRLEERHLVERERAEAMAAYSLECSNRLADLAVWLIKRGESKWVVQMVMLQANFMMGDFKTYG